MAGYRHIIFYLFDTADDGRTAGFQHRPVPFVGHQYAVMHVPVNVGVTDKLAGETSSFVLGVGNGLQDVPCHDIAGLSCACRYLAVPVFKRGGTCGIPIVIGCLVDASQCRYIG